MTKKKSKHQPFTIITTPTLVNKERVYPNKGILIKEANDKRYIYDMTGAISNSRFFGILSLGCGIWFLNSDDIDLLYGTFSVLLILGGAFFTIYAFTVKKDNKMLVLDRLQGTVRYPDYFYFPPLQGAFKDIKAVISISGDIDGAVGREYLKFVNVFKQRKFDLLRTITYGDAYKEWSLYVWYMDKNRPLPPGTAFDPYRENDFERRKTEGFPKPLFKSNIATPEATKAQQAERKKIGGW